MKRHNQNLPGMGGVFNTVNTNLYHYAGNNPVKYTDPTGRWIDNEDGTFTAEDGDTLWDLFGADWQEKSGYTGDPTKLQIGDIVGKRIENLNQSFITQEPINKFEDKNSFIGYTKRTNAFIGLGELLLGVGVIVSSMMGAVGIEISSEGIASYYGGMAIFEGWAAGSMFIAFGIGRLSNVKNNKIADDITNVFIPVEVDLSSDINNYSKGGKNE